MPPGGGCRGGGSPPAWARGKNIQGNLLPTGGDWSQKCWGIGDTNAGAVLFYWGLFIFELLGPGICGAKSIGGGFKVNMNGLVDPLKDY